MVAAAGAALTAAVAVAAFGLPWAMSSTASEPVVPGAAGPQPAPGEASALGAESGPGPAAGSGVTPGPVLVPAVGGRRTPSSAWIPGPPYGNPGSAAGPGPAGDVTPTQATIAGHRPTRAPNPSSSPAGTPTPTLNPGSGPTVTPEPGTSSPPDAPAPSWWKGDCDAGHNPGSYPLGASYRGVEACGPGPEQGGRDRLVHFYPGSNGAYEWECVELVMRYLYLVDGIPPYPGNGDQVVANYPGHLLTKVVNDGHNLPSPGDVVSMSYVHTAVVTAVSVDAGGNGSITLMEENGSQTGSRAIGVARGVVGDSVTGWLHHPAG